jgi:hypothetical protein
MRVLLQTERDEMIDLCERLPAEIPIKASLPPGKDGTVAEGSRKIAIES